MHDLAFTVCWHPTGDKRKKKAAKSKALQAIEDSSDDEEDDLSLKAIAQQMTAAISPGVEADR